MLKTRIKASQIANLTDARYFAAFGVEWLGFNFENGTENYIHPVEMKAIKEWVEGPQMVGEFGGQDIKNIVEVANLLELDAIQIGRFTNAAALKTQLQIPIIKEIVLEQQTSEEEVKELLEIDWTNVDFFLFNFDKNDLTWLMLKKEKTLSIDFIKKICATYNIIISIEIMTEEIEAFLEELNPFGLSLKGGAEEKVGVKSFDELDEIFEVLEILE